MRAIAGLHRPTNGSVVLDAAPITGHPAHAVAQRGVILVPEGRHLFTTMSVLDNLLLGAYAPEPRRVRQQTLRRVCDIFPVLAERQQQLAGTLSGGEQQMVALGRALMGLPRLLLLDEPSLGLAPIVVRTIFDVVATLNRDGMTVLLVEQNARLALELAHRAYILEQGRVVGTGLARDLLMDQQVQQAYLGYVESASTTPSAS
jgi:branched-chain amino acid transport system ATP-binding protein